MTVIRTRYQGLPNLGVHSRRYEAEIEMADRAVALNPNSWRTGTAEARSI